MDVSTIPQSTEGRAPARDPLLFIKEVAKYFMDFLETDFHKRKAPRRAVRSRDSNGLLVGLSLRKYASFYPKIWHVIRHGFPHSVINEIGRGVYRTEVPRNLLELVRLQIERISDQDVSRTIGAVADKLRSVAVSYSKEYDKALTLAMETASRIVGREITAPVMRNLEKPLQNLELGDDNRIFLMQEELTAVLVQILSDKISELLRLAIGKQEIDVEKELSSVFGVAEVKTSVSTFFESLKIGDLFLELFELERNRQILDKQELYLYFCDIAFDNCKYPIFYIPFSMSLREDVLVIEYDAQAYVNKRALEFIVQQVNEQENRRGTMKSCSERVLYLAQYEASFPSVITAVLQELTNVLQLDCAISIDDPAHQVAKSQSVRVSNNCYFALFDRADEALVNDYEEILELLSLGKDNPLAVAFQKLIEDFIHRDPKSFTLEVEQEWDDYPPSDKLVFSSPIPLNSEQRQILSALNKPGCRYVTVEGPPGTGKSHTITAVLFDLIQKDQSVLVLSDKKEALDVVEDKITETMNRVRFDKHFQNPILRLGRTGSTYSEILSTASIDNIKAHFRAVRKEYESVADDIAKSSNALKEDIEAEVVSYDDINTAEIREVIELQMLYSSRTNLPVELSELQNRADGVAYLEELRSVCIRLAEVLRPVGSAVPEMARVLRTLGWTSVPASETAVEQLFQHASIVGTALSKLTSLSEQSLGSIGLFESISRLQLPVLRGVIEEYERCVRGSFGRLLNRRRIRENDANVQRLFRIDSPKTPSRIVPELKDAFATFTAMSDLAADTAPTFDPLTAMHRFLTHPDLRPFLEALISLGNDWLYLKREVFPRIPETVERAGINSNSALSLLKCGIATIDQAEYDGVVRCLTLNQKIQKAFADIPTGDYGDRQDNIEDLVTVQMTHVLDGRVIEFYEDNRATAKTLRDIIRSKRRFPKEEFVKLRKAFPCILAGIRDYAEYVPLEADAFDLLIIDEASQVSVAQAFPALLRARKVLILGDRKQFSNVKAAQARSDTNREYINRLREVFVQNVSDEQSKLVRLEKFNIKASILDFFELITNFQIQLSKYFRGYKEIISFSNRHFYRDSLQVMKIRGKAVGDVLKFTHLPHDGAPEPLPNTNEAEVEFIVSELRKLKESKSSASVGIITPHTNQQKLLVETINKMPERAYLYDALRLKIMTFDTCQGEERDLIFYSMVANPYEDKLWGIFIKNLEDVQIEEEGQIKAQRLNVGLSRAKECMHFVLSKGLEEYAGSIGEALRHYGQTLEDGKRERNVSEVDPKSGMEPKVLHWLYQTAFWSQNKARLEVIPQFKIGEYLRQLDKTYKHPLYRVDFLLIFREDEKADRKIILEYDGFLEHFAEVPGINAENYSDYYSEDDVYRQKVLEGYGYRFIRINRFNVGDNPVEKLNQRLFNLIGKDRQPNSAIRNIQSAVEGLQNGDLKECPKCKQLRPISDFQNSSLASGYSRFCAACKARPASEPRPPTGPSASALPRGADKKCPRCGARMYARTGRYGKFYGCSKYPYCRGTMKL